MPLLPADANLSTRRLFLRPLAPEAFDALIARDAMRLMALMGMSFPEPVEPFPLTDDALPILRDQVRAGSGVSWIAARRDNLEAACHLGFSAGERADTVVAGWSTYPAQQRQGFATEAVGAIITFAFEKLRVKRFEATIPADNAGSIAVAEANAMIEVGTERDPEVGEVLRFARVR